MEGGFRSESRSPKICKLTQNSQRSHKLFGRDVPTWLGSPLPTVQFLCHQSEHFLQQSQKVSVSVIGKADRREVHHSFAIASLWTNRIC
jgi:hypothetical protein